MNRKYIFILSHATTNPMEVVGLMKIATNMKAFDDSIELDFFLIGEGVQLAKKGMAETITVDMEGQKFAVGEILTTLTEDFSVKLYVCQAFMPLYGMTEKDLIEHTEIRSSSSLGEFLLNGRIPFSLNL